MVHRIKHHALFSSVRLGFSTEVCIVYIHVYTHTYACIYMHIKYLFNHCGVSVCIQMCTTNREGRGWGGEKLPAGGGGVGSRDPVLGSRGVGTEE